MRPWRGRQSGAAAAIEDDRKVVLHVGCGVPHPDKVPPKFRGPDWRELRLDIDPGVRPDVVDTIVGLPAVESESVDAVWSSHNLEHVYAHEVPVVVRAFFRVLRPNGAVMITMPDLESVAKSIARGKLEEPLYQSPVGPIAPLDVLYGHRAAIMQGNEFMAHRTGCTTKTLSHKLSQAGFADVEVKSKDFALWAEARKPA